MRTVQRIKQHAKAHVASLAYGRPSTRMQVVLVVGQDGAAHTAALLATMIQVDGQRVGVITQTYVQVAGERVQGSDQADVLGDTFRLHKQLAAMHKAGCGYVIIEVPPSIPIHNFVGVHPALLVIRRCGDSYLNALANGQRLSQVQRLLGLRPKTVACNRDDPAFELIKPSLPTGEKLLTFGQHERAECQIQSVNVSPQGAKVQLLIDHQTEVTITLATTGKQAVYNGVAAAAAAYLLNMSVPSIEDGATRTPPPAGYLYDVGVDRPYQIVLDVAVTPEGIVENLETVSHFSRNRVLAVYGANLQQPALWRPVIGEAIADTVDRVVVTDGDYTHNEHADYVRQQILEGVLQTGAELFTDDIADRRAGLGRAISIARRNDTIVVVASPMRPYRQVGSERVAWSDVQVIEELLS